MLGLVFSNLLFIYLFLPLCLFLYYLTKNPAVRNGVLIVFSLIFYSFGEPVAILLMASSTLIDYFNGLSRDGGLQSAPVPVKLPRFNFETVLRFLSGPQQASISA